MNLSAKSTTVEAILPWRDRYRDEMRCQIVHDSLHSRAGWTIPFLLNADHTMVGYGSILVGGPWKGTRTVFEFYVLPAYRSLVFDLLAILVEAGEATAIQAQTSDTLLTVMLHVWCGTVRSEKIVFADRLATSLPAGGATFRRATADDKERIFAHHREPVGDWLIEFEGAIVATGGIALHYNRPYGDIFMEVAAPFRRRGLGSYLVQELKRVGRESGNIPCARCDTADVASRRTMQKAGLVPCAHILSGAISRP
jgi:GNAT superfamily N-acetyltransferase